MNVIVKLIHSNRDCVRGWYCCCSEALVTSVGLLHTEPSRHNEKHRADDRRVGFHLSAACSHGERTGRSCTAV